MSKPFMYVLFAGVLLVNLAQAQGNKETIDNQSVIDMYKAGLSKDLILSKIANSECHFNTSTQGMIELKKQHVPESIISAMMKQGDKSGGAKPASTPAPATPAQPAGDQKNTPAKGSAAAATTAPDLEILNLIHAWNKKNNQTMALEKTTAQMKSKTKALGYGGVNIVFEVPGEKSTVRLAEHEQPVFLVNTGGALPDGFVLYKLAVKKKYREAVTTNVNGVGQMKGSEGVISVNIKSMKNGLYELIPATALEKGEYFFAQRTGGNALTTTNADVYAFGVD
jgi:hypothetical protein